MGGFLQSLDNFFNAGTGFLFGPIMLCVFFGTGILMTIVTRGVQFRKFGVAIRTVFGALRKKGGDGDGQLKPYQALATALSSCVGNGNVVGVSAALVSGGPGAIFWMWIAAITGMATKYAEIMLAMHFREKDEKGIWRGGVMYILTRGVDDHYHFKYQSGSRSAGPNLYERVQQQCNVGRRDGHHDQDSDFQRRDQGRLFQRSRGRRRASRPCDLRYRSTCAAEPLRDRGSIL